MSMLAIVEELLARDLVPLDGVNADFFEGDAFASRFGGDVEREVNDMAKLLSNCSSLGRGVVKRQSIPIFFGQFCRR
jgi:hypothetical protein